jgi:uncharacterized protein (TIGR03435 family)
MRGIAGLLAFMLLGTGSAAEQSALAAHAPAFEAVSIKENDSGRLDGAASRVPGRFTVSNLSLEWVIQTAFGVREHQLVDVPNWAKRRFDIAATFVPREVSLEEFRSLLQQMLADRFGLRAHREQRPMMIYELTQASPGVLGPKLRPVPDTDCATAPLAAPQCRRFMAGFFVRGLWSTTQLARALEQVLGRPVLDRSNLAGTFDIDLQWGDGNIADPIATLGVNEQAALQAAVRDDLGLRLQSKREPMDVIVLDAVSAPTPN